MTLLATSLAVSEMYCVTASALKLRLWLQQENMTIKND
eukprot:CAMPEP_0183780926 /NCGR_PEP_ID=MMETSP0739-20130205/57523_1 /TAXON_ID=385413 /ORGANISM="Thalassiosira miniscula, Strain CCMP1093" /LENGTH=37 /DNA_ID= /DNA_START= /DNA_END= /DNA_ORIENTATION=